MKNEPIIKVRHLTTAYNGVTILDDLSFDIMRGQVFIILGGSGCGKSTLMKHLIGLYEPVCGEIFIEDRAQLHAQLHKDFGRAQNTFIGLYEMHIDITCITCIERVCCMCRLELMA